MKAKRKLPRRRIGVQLNMTPMIDVVFQLIIFFTMVAEFARIENEEVELPVADQARTQEVVPAGRLVINVDERGALVVANHTVDFPTLRQWLRQEANAHKTGPGEIRLEVLIRSDGRAEFGPIQDILLECARNGIWQVSFAAMTEERPPSAGPEEGL